MQVPWLEIVGYAASVLTAVSLMMASHVRLRLLNLVGSSVFALYGFLIHAYPVGALNVFIAAVDLFFLLRIARNRTLFTLLPMPACDVYFAHFLDFFRKDIAAFFPAYHAEAPVDFGSGCIALYVLRNAVTAGVFVARRDPADPGTVVVELDYVTPEFRDYRTAEFLFRDQAAYFQSLGVKRIDATADVKAHERYLRRVGFRELPCAEDGGPPRFVLTY
jgi:hypothetical protein